MMTRDQHIAALKQRKRTQEQAEAQADAKIAAHAARAAKRAAASAKRDYALALRGQPGTPTYNAQLQRWERKL